ncbi:zinc finger protein 675-like [Ctenocephalides felis]|uniref:zinc finger protein 675-like n=1 Tax=Ctenocephalides felis TaxID=7515 RepID=UPI000E6E32B2|nr:zinc finger protein 675-like [Ctenocephalides felis]
MEEADLIELKLEGIDELDIKDGQLVIIKDAFKQKDNENIKFDNCITAFQEEVESSQPKVKKHRSRVNVISNECQESMKNYIKAQSECEDDSECETDICSDEELEGVSDSEKNDDGSLNGTKPRDSWDTYPWLCTVCSKKCETVMELRSHYSEIHRSSPKYMCADCTKPYNKYHTFISHVRAHRIHLRFCCDMCSKYFANRKTLGLHRSQHCEKRPYICRKCGKGFRAQSALQVHSRAHLPDELKNKYHCDLCPKRFGTKPNLMAHKRIHSGIRDYTCDQCGKSFIQKGNLDNHMLTHMNYRPYSCDICGKAFKTAMRLKKHETVHSGLKPHQCDVCGRQFRERGTLREHHRIHTGAMPFSCEFCGKCFRFKGVLTTHRRQHTGERPYSCLECQHHFTNWPNYNKHMKRRHGINTSVTVRKPQTIPPTGMPDRSNMMHIVPTIHNNMQGTIVVPQHDNSEFIIPTIMEESQDVITNSNTTQYINQDNQTTYSITAQPQIHVASIAEAVRNQQHVVLQQSLNAQSIQLINTQPAHSQLISNGMVCSTAYATTPIVNYIGSAGTAAVLGIYNLQGLDISTTDLLQTGSTIQGHR